MRRSASDCTSTSLRQRQPTTAHAGRRGSRRDPAAQQVTEARARLSTLLAAKTTGAPVANRTMTVTNAVERFLERDVPNRERNGRPDLTVDRQPVPLVGRASSTSTAR